MFCQAMIKMKRRKQKSARATLEKTKRFHHNNQRDDTNNDSYTNTTSMSMAYKLH